MPSDVKFPEELLEALYKATLEIAGADSLDNVLKTIATSAKELVRAEHAAIGTFDGSRKLARLFVSDADSEATEFFARKPTGLGVLGRLSRERMPIRLSRLADVRSSSGLPEAPSLADSFLGVPIVAGSELLGNLYLTNKVGEEEFSEDDERLVEMLAAHAAIAIEKAKLLEAHAQYSAQLERRNSQLAALNQATMAITGELTLDKVLKQIVDSARDLCEAEFAALGVPSTEGSLDTFVHSGMSEGDEAKIDHLPRGLGLLGAIIRDKRPIRVPSIAEDPRHVGFPPGHLEMTSFMGVPVTAGGQALGNLYLTNKRAAKEFSAEDQELLEMLAAHAAIVIQNSRLYEQVGRLAIIAERARIGMDLHDGVIQSIFAVGLTLESARLGLAEGSDEADLLLGNAIVGLNDTIRDIRNFILDLRPHRFSGDLQQGLARLVREFQANTMVPVSLEMSLEDGPTPSPAVARAIFLTTQEALANIARHAKASRVAVEAVYVDDAIKLSVLDDGQGFDVRSKMQTVGHGLSNMRARAETLKGSFSLHSSPGEGTQVLLRLPCQ